MLRVEKSRLQKKCKISSKCHSQKIIDHWNRESHPYKKLEFGKWELVLPPNLDGSPAVSHLSEVKVS